MATPRIGGGGEASWLAEYGVVGRGNSGVGRASAEGVPLTCSVKTTTSTVSPQVLDENSASQPQPLSEKEEMLLLIGELEEQLELERQRSIMLERKAAFAAGVLPPDLSASPRELQLQRDELLEFIGEMQEANIFAVAQQAVHSEATPVASHRGYSVPVPDSATKQTQLLSDADAWLMQSAQLAATSSRPSSAVASPPADFAVPLRNLVRGTSAQSTPARRLMEEARVLREMIAARNSPRLHCTISNNSSCGSGRKKKALAQRAPLQRLSSNALTPRQLHNTAPPPAPSPVTTARALPSLPSCQTARSCAASALGVDVSAVSDRIVLFFVSKMQAWARGVLARRWYGRQRNAAVMIQRHARGAAGREHAERLRQAELAMFLTPFKTSADANTNSPGSVELESSQMNLDKADHSLTAEEEAEWDQWLQRAKAAEEAAQVQHQFALQHQQKQQQQQQQQQQEPWRRQQVTFEDATADDNDDQPEPAEGDVSALSDLVESVDV